MAHHSLGRRKAVALCIVAKAALDSELSEGEEDLGGHGVAVMAVEVGIAGIAVVVMMAPATYPGFLRARVVVVVRDISAARAKVDVLHCTQDQGRMCPDPAIGSNKIVVERRGRRSVVAVDANGARAETRKRKRTAQKVFVREPNALYHQRPTMAEYESSHCPAALAALKAAEVPGNLVHAMIAKSKRQRQIWKAR